MCIEGIDSCGKATQTKRLVERLQSESIRAERLSFPDYSTEIGRLIQTTLGRDPSTYGTPREHALTLQSLMTTNRYEHYGRLLGAAVDSSRVLVLDRYWYSAYAYGASDGLDTEWLVEIHAALPQPALALYLDVSVAESFRRRPVRQDMYEASKDRLLCATGNYLDLCSRGLLRRVDGERSEDDVAQAVWDEVRKQIDPLRQLSLKY